MPIAIIFAPIKMGGAPKKIAISIPEDTTNSAEIITIIILTAKLNTINNIFLGGVFVFAFFFSKSISQTSPSGLDLRIGEGCGVYLTSGVLLLERNTFTPIKENKSKTPTIGLKTPNITRINGIAEIMNKISDKSNKIFVQQNFK